MKFLNALSLMLFISINVIASTPDAQFHVAPNGNINQDMIEGIGSIFTNKVKNNTEILFVSKDLESSWKINIRPPHIKNSNDYFYQTGLKTFVGEEDIFYVCYWYEEVTNYTFNIIKANKKGVIKKASYKIKVKSYSESIFFNGSEIVVLITSDSKGFNINNKTYTIYRFKTNDLTQQQETQLNLPKLNNNAEWNFLGMKNDLMTFYVYTEPDIKAGIENSGIYLILVDKKDQIVKDKVIAIPSINGKEYVNVEEHGNGNYGYIGPSYGIKQSPYTNDIFLYTYFKNKGSKDREGVSIIKFKFDENNEELVFHIALPYLNGPDRSEYYQPYIKIFEDDFLSISYKEKMKGKKYFQITAILDPNGNIIAHETIEEPINTPIAFKRDFQDFLKESKVSNKTNFTNVSTKLALDDPDAELDLVKFDDKWIVIKISPKTGKINFYKV